MKHIAALLTLALVLLPAEAQPGKIIDQKPIPQASPLDIKLPPEVLDALKKMGEAGKQIELMGLRLQGNAISVAWYDGMFRGAVGMAVIGILLYLGVEKWRSKAA